MNTMSGRTMQLAVKLLKAGCIKDKTKSPGGKGYRLKLHEKQPNAPLSPIYINMRTVQSLPALKTVAVYAYAELLASFDDVDLLAGIPVAATPMVSSLMDLIGIPMITPRVGGKTHGSGASIDGVFVAGQRVVVIDDLMTKADSKLEAIEILEAAGLVVVGVVVLVDREQGGREALEARGFKVAAAVTLRQLLEFYFREAMITKGVYTEITEYLALPN